MAHPYVPPELAKSAFNCPSCGAFAQQHWSEVWLAELRIKLGDWRGAYCGHCRRPSLWCDGRMIYPSGGTAPLPNPDMPEDIQTDYEEARAILGRSPRASAALLRLAIQKLCRYLGESGEDINRDIASLVRKGLLPAVQQSLDAVRVVGNNAVHPGTISLQDNPEIAAALFALVNLIVEQMITAPAQADAVYALLPEGARAAIARRDGEGADATREARRPTG